MELPEEAEKRNQAETPSCSILTKQTVYAVRNVINMINGVYLQMCFHQQTLSNRGHLTSTRITQSVHFILGYLLDVLQINPQEYTVS